MESIVKHIDALLLQHDCVVVPKLGGFIAMYTSATLSASQNVATPPKKSFVFNRFLLHNDGLLAHEISAANTISYVEAVALLEQHVATIKSTLVEKKRFELPPIGVLFSDSEGAIRLNTSDRNYMLTSFGLPVVKAIALTKREALVVKEQIIQLPLKKETVSTENKVIPISKPIKQQRRRSSKWWIAAALLPLGFYSVWIPLKTDLLKYEGNFHYSDLNPFSFSKCEASYNSNFNVIASIDSLSTITLDFPVVENAGTVKINIKKKPKEKNITPESTYVEVSDKATTALEYVEITRKTYFVIGGCFSKEKNAINFVASLQEKGFDAVVVDKHKGLHRVAFGQYSSNGDAKNAKESISQEGYSTWVLKKQ